MQINRIQHWQACSSVIKTADLKKVPSGVPRSHGFKKFCYKFASHGENETLSSLIKLNGSRMFEVEANSILFARVSLSKVF